MSPRESPHRELDTQFPVCDLFIGNADPWACQQLFEPWYILEIFTPLSNGMQCIHQHNQTPRDGCRRDLSSATKQVNSGEGNVPVSFGRQ